MSKLTNRVANERGSATGSLASELSGARLARSQPLTTSGYQLANEDPIESQEPPTLTGVDVLAERLDLAIRELGQKEDKIRALEQELEELRSIRPTLPQSASLLAMKAATPSAAPAEVTATRASEVPELDEGGGIQWHRVIVAAGASQRPSLPPNSQRRAERRPAELHVEFDSDTQFYAGITRDISEGGVFIATYCVQSVGTKLGLCFELPCGTRVETRGTVRWLREPSHDVRPGMGVAFDELSAESLAAIGRFCSQHAPLYVEE